MVFLDRHAEMERLAARVGQPAFGFITGRRRVGKSALLRQLCSKHQGFYYQAIEGTPEQQVLDFAEELAFHFPIFASAHPRGWKDLFNILGQQNLPPVMVLDELPYLAQSSREFASILQRWIDMQLPHNPTLFLVSGSSQAMLHSLFLNGQAPLFGRATLQLHLEPLNYHWFCKAMDYSPQEAENFERFSLVGGIPHYWHLLPQGSVIEQAEILYFRPSSFLAEEPRRILNDEGIHGMVPRSIIDLIGRGVARPSEVALRLQMPQGSLSRPLALLQDVGLIVKDMPFGESSRSSKRVLYQLVDPSLAFYYGSYLPKRSRWHAMSQSQKARLIHEHASKQWEYYCRQNFPGSGRYWDNKVEIDLVAPLHGAEQILVAECKWRRISAREKKSILSVLKSKFEASALAHRLKKRAVYRVFSQEDIGPPMSALIGTAQKPES